MIGTMGGNYGTLHRAIVRSVQATGVVVEIPLLAPNASWGPIPTAVPNLAVGEAVICAQISTSRDTLVVLGRVPGRAPTVGEIPTLSATIAAIQASDAAASSAATALTARVTTAESNITTNTNNTTSNTTAIAGHTTRLNTDEANITTNTTGLATANTALTALTARVTTLEDATLIGRRRTVYQVADQQQNNANGGTNYTSSTYLTLPVVANGVYLVNSQFIYDTTTTPQIKFKFLLPTGSPNLRIAPWFSGDPAGNAAIWHDVFDGVEFVPGAKGAGGGYMSCRPGVAFTVGSTGGSFTVQFAQNVSDIAYAVLKVGSFIELTRMA